MSWKLDESATRAAGCVFGSYRPRAITNGSQYIVQPTPYGRIELMPVGGKCRRYLVAAELPPDRAECSPDLLSDDIVTHLRRHHLHPWQIIAGGEITAVLLELAMPEKPKGSESHNYHPWSRYARRLGRPRRVVGGSREGLVRRLAALVASQQPACPIPILAGPFGVGKHALAAATAHVLGLPCVELPLGRLFAHRMLATPQEVFLETILAGAPQLTAERCLLVVSDAELLAGLQPRDRVQVMMELIRLPHALLLATADDAASVDLPNSIGVSCPGLKTETDAHGLLNIERPELTLVDAVVKTMCRESNMPGIGIVPGRLLFLAKLGHALLEPRGMSGNRRLFPDDVAAAAAAARQAWQEDDRGEDNEFGNTGTGSI